MSGLLFVITAPSGAGKSSLIDALLEDDPRLALSISYTTRAPRPGEVNGREYHFVDDEDLPGDAASAASSSRAPRCTATATAPRRR